MQTHAALHTIKKNSMEDDATILAPGKIPSSVLGPLLAQLPSAGALIPPSLGVDACAVELGSPYLCIKSDPITMARGQSGEGTNS